MEEASKQKELEKLRLDEAALSQQEHFLQENLIRLFGEMEAFTKRKPGAGRKFEIKQRGNR